MMHDPAAARKKLSEGSVVAVVDKWWQRSGQLLSEPREEDASLAQ